MSFVIAAGCLVMVTSALAGGAARSDASATHSYLEDVLGQQHEMASTESARLSAIEGLAARLKTECPNVLAGAPPHTNGEKVDESTREVDQEVTSAAFNAAENVAHRILAKFARKVARLRWSNRRLTRLLRSLAREAAVQSAIMPPGLCMDLKYWVSSGYTKLSQGTVIYEKRRSDASSITQIESEPNEPVEDIFIPSDLIRHRLRPYENHRDMRLVQKAFPPQPLLGDPRLTPLFEAVGSVYTALGRTSA